MRKKIVIFSILLVLIIPSVTGCITVVKIGEEGKLTGEVEFNAGDNVEKIWDSAAIPDLTQKAVDLSTFLTEANGDLESLADQYGKYSMGTSGELNYVVKGTATVKEVNQEKKAGYMVITLEHYSGSEDIQIQIGPVYKGSSVRDSLDFIKYDDYKNQVEWAAVSQSINKLIHSTIIEQLDFKSLEGKTIEFIGCFTANSSDQILITPVQLTVQ